MFNSVNNTFFIIHKIFEESIKNFMNNEFNKNENLKKIKNDKNFIKILCVGDNGKTSGILFHLNKEMMNELACQEGSVLCKIDKMLKIGDKIPKEQEQTDKDKSNESIPISNNPDDRNGDNPRKNVINQGGTRRHRKRKSIKKSKRNYHKKSIRNYHKKSIRK